MKLHLHHGAIYFRIRRSLSHAASLWHNELVVLGVIHNSQLLLSLAFRFLFFSLKLFQRARVHEPDWFLVRPEWQTWRQLGRGMLCTCANNQQDVRASAGKRITAAVQRATRKNLLLQRSWRAKKEEEEEEVQAFSGRTASEDNEKV